MNNIPIQSKNSENSSDTPEENSVREDFAIPPAYDFSMDDIRNSFTDESDKSTEEHTGDKMPEATAMALSEMIVYGIDILHDEMADAYNYDKMRLTAKEKEMWQFCMKQLVPNLPIKYAVIIITALILGLAEGRKFIGLQMELQRRKKPA